MTKAPVHVSISVDVARPESTQQTRIWVNGVDLTSHVHWIRVDAGVGALADVWLDLVGVTLDVHAEVPPRHIKEMTLQEDQAHQEAQQTLDVDRGKKPRPPHALLAVSLGQKP